MLKDRKQRKDIFIVLILFLFSILYHYFIGDFTKGLETYPDELRYFSIARSIARGEGFLIRGINYGYQKIMYSLFLSPIFWFKDPALIVKLINLLNSVAMASTVIPAYRIAKRIRANQLATYLFCFFVAIWSETIITMTFMAEVIYWPLCFWFIDLWLSIQEKGNAWKIVLLGVVCYMGYLTKEIFLALFLGVIFFSIGKICLALKKGDRNYAIEETKSIMLFVITFVFIFVGFKKLFFEGLSNSYSNQITLDVILNPYGFAYMMYAAIYYVAAILVSLFIIPWLRVLSLYREYSKPIKNLIIFISMVLLISVGTIAFTISVREDLGRIAPRLHMRYLMPFILIYLLLYFVSMDGLNTKAFGSNRRKMFLFIALAFCALVFKGTTLGSSVDQYSFMWTIKLETILSGLTIPILGKNVPLYLIFIVGLIMGIALVLSIFEKNARTKNEIIFFSVLLLVMNIGNTILAYDEFKPAYQFDKWDVEEVIQLSTYIDEDGDDARVLMILENGLSAKAQVLDTFFDTEGEEIYITGAFARDYENEEQVSTIPFEEAIWGEQYPLVNEIEYVIIEKNIFDHEYTLENMDVIKQVGGRNFVLVKNQDNLTFGVDCK